LLRAADGDFVVETICALALEGRPGSGGLLLWKDEDNYLLLDWGRGGPNEICLEGCLGRKDVVVGRGRLPAERVFLRLERHGARVDALCSADGETWWSVGHADFPTEDPVQIGLCAIGAIDRAIYPGAYREGTAIRFEVLRVW
jgi:regulation of enolase protein 1 (concanavalin A-like superfamily)